MTTEVAIANAGGIALAADSAVTIGGQKIYNSALKLFSLSKTEPVGIMIYGNAGLLDVPWEIIIKSFRKELGSKSYEKLEEYSENFLNFIIKRQEFFSKKSQEYWFLGNIKGYFELIREDFLEKSHPILQSKGKISQRQTQQLIRKVIKDHYDSVCSKPIATGMTDAFATRVRRKYSPKFKEISEAVFQNIQITRPLMSKLSDIAVGLLTREIFSNGKSGIVIAGYGDREIYPSIVTYEIEGYFDGMLKYKAIEQKTMKISSGNECTIIAFAQEDMVYSFMNGINPAVQSMLNSYLQRLVERLPELLHNTNLNAIELADFSDKSKRLLKEFFYQLCKHIKDEHVNPVLSMVKVLPKDELAAMAEALVNLTAFKRKMTDSVETVGGPIDVAVISKGDGLVWVSRKHYFPPELNQHFFRNYFRGMSDEKER
jgi:hypothetical protein